jgi:hypothetical protein
MPLHEPVQPASLFDDIGAGTHVVVVCVAQDYLCPQLFKLGRRHRLYGRLRAHWHEARGLYPPVRGDELSGAGSCLGTLRDQSVLKHRSILSSRTASPRSPSQLLRNLQGTSP